jgi:hypothetical protein
VSSCYKTETASFAKIFRQRLGFPRLIALGTKSCICSNHTSPASPKHQQELLLPRRVVTAATLSPLLLFLEAARIKRAALDGLLVSTLYVPSSSTNSSANTACDTAEGRRSWTIATSNGSSEHHRLSEVGGQEKGATAVSFPHHAVLLASRNPSSSGYSSPLSSFGEDPVVEDLNNRKMTTANVTGIGEPFPEKLHRLLRDVEFVGRTDVVSFVADDTFRIHDSLAFFQEVMPQYFRQTKLTSFKRQLKIYGFELLTKGCNIGGYRHKLFSKKDATLCRTMKRVAIKGQSGESKGNKRTTTSKGEQDSSNEDEGICLNFHF